MTDSLLNVTQKLIHSHLVRGNLEPGSSIALRIDQTLTQDATGTLVMLELEALGLDRVKTEVSVQYVDHNLIQGDYKNPDDHLFLRSAAKRFGVWYSRPGNGVSHPVHQARFGKPGATLLGSDSHTPAAGAIGMLAMGAGGLDVALAMAGEPYTITMPEVWGIRLEGQLPPWVSAKDVILEMLRRHGVSGGVGRVLEYMGPGLEQLSVMDRHVIANMGTELGATSTVFPSDDHVQRYLASHGREQDWSPLTADEGATYDVYETLDLSTLEPLIAMPSSPGNVQTVRSVAGEPIYQAYIGSSANPGFRDFAVAAEMVDGRVIPSDVSLDINPTSRHLLTRLIQTGHLGKLVEAGARIHQAGCNGCIGMGQAPATGQISLRTVPRNFPGRSGTPEDRVCLVSPETAVASALRGVITDPRDLSAEMAHPHPETPPPYHGFNPWLDPPLSPEEAAQIELKKGPNIVSLPHFDPLPDELELPVLLCVGDDISTDEIMPAGANVLPFRSNIPEISRFVFRPIDRSYYERAMQHRTQGGHAIVGGQNYGQGSSREHAAIAPRYLGLRVVLARSWARIHWRNLINFGILPLDLPDNAPEFNPGDILMLKGLSTLGASDTLNVQIKNGDSFSVGHHLSSRHLEVLARGGIIPWHRESVGARG